MAGPLTGNKRPAPQFSFKGHYLRHYNSSPLFTARATPRRIISEPTDDKPGMQVAFYEPARRAYSHVYRLKRWSKTGTMR